MSTPHGYEVISDPVDLRIAVRELTRVHTWLRQYTDIAIETVDVSAERVAGVGAAALLVARLRELAIARLVAVTSQPGQADVMVIDPGLIPLVESSAGVSEVPIVSRPAAATDGISSAEITIRPGHASVPRWYSYDTIVLGIVGRVSIVWWDAHGIKHQQESPRRHHTCIPGGIRHCVYNAGLLPATAVQCAAAASVTADVAWVAEETPDETSEAVTASLPAVVGSAI